MLDVSDLMRMIIMGVSLQRCVDTESLEYLARIHDDASWEATLRDCYGVFTAKMC